MWQCSSAAITGGIPALRHNKLRQIHFLCSLSCPIFDHGTNLSFYHIQVRLQLQKGRAGSDNAVYKNSIDCMIKIAKREGLSGLQKVRMHLKSAKSPHLEALVWAGSEPSFVGPFFVVKKQPDFGLGGSVLSCSNDRLPNI